MNTRWFDVFLSDQGYVTGHINERLKSFLVDRGYPQQLNEAMFRYLRSRGGTGSLADMLDDVYKGRLDISPPL